MDVETICGSETIPTIESIESNKKHQLVEEIATTTNHLVKVTRKTEGESRATQVSQV